MSDKKIFDYPGEQVDVHWDGRLCIHIAECGHAKGDLFTTGRQPWCVPDKATPDEVVEVCERCPSGALTYTDKSGRAEQAVTENTVYVTYNGPLYLSGELAIFNIAWQMLASVLFIAGGALDSGYGYAGLAISLVSHIPTLSHANNISEYRIKAAFIYNFARFTQWPDDTDELKICIYGDDPFGSSNSPQQNRSTGASHQLQL